jgi:hypothetical protein
VFVIWFAAVLVLDLVAVARAPYLQLPAWCGRAHRRWATAADDAISSIGRWRAAAVVLLAGWSITIAVGWILGNAARRLQRVVDRPVFDWWAHRHLGGAWSSVWWKLTDIGSTTVTQSVAVAGGVALAVLYRDRWTWWAPPVTLLVGYLAEKYSQTLLVLAVHRAHPPTSLGTWPSGGMGRLILIYGLIIYFVITRYWLRVPRAWAGGGALLAVLASVQAYARINNLEHWLTDVIGGAIYGVLLLALLIVVHLTLTHEPRPTRGGPARSAVTGPTTAPTAVW